MPASSDTPAETVDGTQPAATESNASFAEMEAWLWLANAQLPARAASELLRQTSWDPLTALQATDEQLIQVAGLLSRHAERLRDRQNRPPARVVDWALAHHLQVVPQCSGAYPAGLRSIGDAPAALYVLGNVGLLTSPGLAIVGTRTPTPYGRAVAERFARELAALGVTIVSGAAHGIDTAAHRAALDAGGGTTAVIGCGLDVAYPRENRELLQRIARSGALVSEYGLGAKPDSWRFPQRNRIISGLSDGVLVAEAAAVSGALLTARLAAEQGRVVLAVPGNIDRASAVGCNELIKSGVTVATCKEDVLAALRYWPVKAPASPASQLTFDEGEQNPPAATGSAAVRMPDLPTSQAAVLAVLSLVPQHIDTVAELVQRPVADTAVELTMLELATLVARLPGNLFVRTF
ncbi:MAG: DNA-processing protein DprA [Armatimonadetes bacterium]|nr:DNA-processing protein DprA [Armatimonadota bacterium]MDE2206500.1 DNA-processing protein DprA [Armatimonadota bacterium]